MDTDTTDLTGKLLVAMPGMGDPRFEKSVILLCAHGEDGAMGLIINKPAPDLALGDLLEQLSIPAGEDMSGPIHFGGPVENARGFVLHSRDYSLDEMTLEVGETFGMTATLDILRHIASGEGPVHSLIALGYAGWGPGQLEEEIVENGWLVTDAISDLVFDADDTGKWIAAIASLGFDPILLSGTAGSA
ncbi:putative transcriptional regulator [Palleronia aestuarii]|uniref:UPF0301 protein LX81_00021 n=1 Tax=Palleronia aestuarii TaxID=568105 RepID=A0A2W7NGN5_9RHOB|nr:YqgE/AlgH family protein [Palleronia aestuarii]PZX19565.1 putative transcriptional regulator [Palleronia aestuarii]